MRKYFCVIAMMISGLLGFAAVSYSQTENFCQAEYEKTGECPLKTCQLGCYAGLHFEGCLVSCNPKPCVEIEGANCPEDRCQKLIGCEKKEFCYSRPQAETPECGGISYSGQEVDCCEGLVKRCGIEFFDGTCDMIGKDSMYGVPVCLPCGNGICNQFENKCNCPEDCDPDFVEAEPEEQTNAVKEEKENKVEEGEMLP